MSAVSASSIIFCPRTGYARVTTQSTSKGHWTNIVDLESAIELYTPMYQLLLSDRAFWRSSISLQLDETIALYVARLLGDPTIVALANNKHPLVPLTTLRAGFRLVVHGLSTELLHALLVQAKLAQGGNSSHP